MRTASNRPIRSHRSHTHSRCAFVRVSKEAVQPVLLDEGLAGTKLNEGLAGTMLDEGRIRVVYF